MLKNSDSPLQALPFFRGMGRTVADTFETGSKCIKVVLTGGKFELFEVTEKCSHIKAMVWPAEDPKRRALSVLASVSDK